MVTSADIPTGLVAVGYPASDFRKQEKTQESARSTYSPTPESADSVIELENEIKT